MKNKGLFLTIVSLTSLLNVGCHKSDNDSLSSTTSSNNQQELSPIITEDIVEAANKYEYGFVPESILIKEQESYDYSNNEIKALEIGEYRENHHLVYAFEGSYDLGLNPGMYVYYSYAYLWDDGLYCAILDETIIKGYWYNSSKNAPIDDITTKDINESKDCLILVSNQENYEIVTAELLDEESYSYLIKMQLVFSWGIRETIMCGYYYYPDVAISLLDYLNDEFSYRVGDYFDPSSQYTVVHIMKNLCYIPIFVSKRKDITWDVTNDMVDENSNLIRSGKFSVIVHYKDFSHTLSITVK